MIFYSSQETYIKVLRIYNCGLVLESPITASLEVLGSLGIYIFSRMAIFSEKGTVQNGNDANIFSDLLQVVQLGQQWGYGVWT